MMETHGNNCNSSVASSFGFPVLILFFLILLSSSAFAQNLTEVVTEPAETGLEILSGWQALAVMAIIISILFIAIGYAVGIGFEMPEMEAWARSELGQVFANVIIITSFLGVVIFIDTMVVTIINTSGVPVHCGVFQNCLEKVSVEYIQEYIDIGKGGAKNALENSVVAAGWMNRRVGIYAKKLWPWLQMGGTTTLAANYVLDFDRYGIIFNYYQGLLSSLEAQKFFIQQICFKVGPLILALGIVARSFFVTRKLGGLLIAIAASIMVFFPLMYVFDWMSLEIAATGDIAGDLGQGNCPVECSKTPPLAYYDTTKVDNMSALYMMFDEEDFDDVQKLAQGKIESLVSDNPSGRTVYSCDYNTGCNRTCRELPYPSGNQLCADVDVQKACAALDERCKVVRTATVSEADKIKYESCPAECKIIPPLRSDCNVKADGTSSGGRCLESRFDCRVAKMNDLDWRPKMPNGMKGKQKCDYAKECHASNTSAFDSCTYVMPELGLCSQLCAGCPQECRVDVTAGLPANCTDIPEIADACSSCLSTCKAQVSKLDDSDCSGCPKPYRLIADSLGLEYTNGACSFENCPFNTTYRAVVPYSACEECIFSEEPAEYNPPIRADCAEQCKPSTNTPTKNAGDYSKIDEDGLVGREEIKNVAKLMVPAYLLPLLNIALTLMLIRTLSGILGGDIEIPGLQRIF